MKQHFYGYVLGISTAMALLKIGSMINCRGLSSDKIKRRDIFLKCRQNYISFLIDTHSKNETEPYWRSEWGNDIKFSFSSVIVGA